MIYSFINKMNVISLGFILRHDPSKNNPSLSGLKILSGEPRDAQVRAWPFVYTERKPFSEDTIPVAVHRRASERGSDGGREGGRERDEKTLLQKENGFGDKRCFCLQSDQRARKQRSPTAFQRCWLWAALQLQNPLALTFGICAALLLYPSRDAN